MRARESIALKRVSSDIRSITQDVDGAIMELASLLKDNGRALVSLGVLRKRMRQIRDSLGEIEAMADDMSH